jgi:hypothetical protein
MTVGLSSAHKIWKIWHGWTGDLSTRAAREDAIDPLGSPDPFS